MAYTYLVFLHFLWSADSLMKGWFLYLGTDAKNGFGCRHLIMEYTGYRLGTIGMFVVTFLFLPISRGSVLLRVIDVPFEHATRYHIWLGNLTMSIFTLHSLCYMVSWGLRGNLSHKVSLSSWFKFFLSQQVQSYSEVAFDKDNLYCPDQIDQYTLINSENEHLLNCTTS